MVASCGVMANGGARSLSYIQSGGLSHRDKEEMDTKQPVADTA